MTQLKDDAFSEAVAFGRFLAGVPRLVRRRMSVDEAQAIIRHRLANRAENFLSAMDHGVWANPRSPYLALLKVAGVTRADVQELVSKEGLEGTLGRLRSAGVYVSFEEFKGLQPIVRGSQRIDAVLTDFDTPASGGYYSSSTGGSTGPGRRVLLDLGHLEALLPGRILVREVQGVRGIPAASWGDLPPSGGLKGILLHAAAGEDASHWFCALPFEKAKLRYRLATHAALAAARLGGAKVAWPVHVPFERAVEIARWAARAVQQAGACTVHASVSRLLRIGVAAKEHGIDLTGTVLRGGGEPPTPTKVEQITATGATFRSSYAFSEVGTVGSSCLHGQGPNDQHFMQDHLAVVQAPRRVPGFDLEVNAFCFTSLLSSAPKLLLNVESDDYGIMGTRSCGCRWESLGFPVHLSEIRSFRKLTGEGMTLIGTVAERVLEEALPARFGGSALDYQFLEEEDEKGFTRLTLRVAPSITLGSESDAIAFVLDALERGGGGAAVAQSSWRQAGTLRIRREAPRMTTRGKLLPLDLTRRVS